MELRKYKLGEIAEIIPGYAFKSSDFGHGKNIAIKIKDIVPPGIDIKNADTVDVHPGERYQLQSGDYVMAMTGATIGKIGKIGNCEKRIFINQRVCKFIANNLCDKEYLYYVLNSDYFQKFVLNNIDSKLAQPNIGHPTLYKFENLYPTLLEQKRIASVLSNIDSKIELNRAINQNLAAMAKQLYDYWFVQFDFPNEEGKPYKSSGGEMVWNEKLKREIPKGWQASNVCSIADILSGGTPSKQEPMFWNNGTIPFFGPTDYSGSIFQIETAENITAEGLSRCASSLFDVGTIIITARGSIGKMVIVGTPMAMNQSCYALKSRNNEFEYLFFLTAQLIECLKAKGSGSTFKSIISSDIEQSTLCIAPQSFITQFGLVVKPLFEKIKDNSFEIATLTKQRNELLPLLMNGQVSVNSDLSAH